jgi:Cu(I)/Ag(I) efflux system membrane fusion protein
MPSRTFQGRVTFIDPFIDQNQRVATVRTQVANPKRQLKPNMFAKGVLTSRIKEQGEALMIPQTSVLWTGKRSIVYVKNTQFDQPTFTYREIELGAETGDHYIVEEGLKKGDKIVTNGVFTVDAAAQLQGKKSMMNQMVGESSSQHPDTLGYYKESTPEEFKQQLGRAVSYYLSMKDALVASEPDRTQSAAGQLQTALAKVDMTLLEGDAHKDWMSVLRPMKANAQSIATAAELKQQRQAFIELSNALIQAVDAYGVSDVKLYRQHCPMANDNQGADWISSEKRIRNPYYGDQMLTCGEVTDTLL